jgi:hypothetical protein
MKNCENIQKITQLVHTHQILPTYTPKPLLPCMHKIALFRCLIRWVGLDECRGLCARERERERERERKKERYFGGD